MIKAESCNLFSTNRNGIKTEPFKNYWISCVKPKDAGENWLGEEIKEPVLASRIRNMWHDQKGRLISYDQFVTEAIPAN
ncbi:hypothetical protein GZ77_07300 [Endozoicomonas montiporae]|uniref:Uncharacterized protein n=2 Tax=Endozoicomonas montiporae TaxID=1027273 RepID=A0A081N6Z9_9GAMM|nr:hypothetical protein [Endozoicomonas montiporae]AMO55970.1 hypothetical protein EZMO1_1827 [Endozoicomonas montiporae CL-33]KEQ14222.1 hypothetical protein GZ77_07300 [Endozoicomonas montiporae]